MTQWPQGESEDRMEMLSERRRQDREGKGEKQREKNGDLIEREGGREEGGSEGGKKEGREGEGGKEGEEGREGSTVTVL